MLGSKGKGILSRRLKRAGKETALTVLALTGCLCLLAVTAGALLNVSLVVFRTGSMSPGIEPGAIAIVQKVPASSLRQGDVATVQREGSSLPVTHRIVASEADPTDPQTFHLTMKGDANASEDPVRYTVQTAKKLLFSAPGVGFWVMRLQNPWFMAFCTIAIASLVSWTFWPRTGSAQVLSAEAGRE
ncbi:S26 family signal peptidase [Arthrobacter sp. PGP41]|uniref:S26 family signal peptidase n=1 Tax=Arthrobacter sp. PGP41 TaxID=2079227 RepID=UPI000CDC976A|nr:S26 family signal peptidase [Arthrobacter sp. PGP41]AUZ35688.1 S26 family signal peptidase [Arthrobacter sp. PGP41]